MRDLLRRALAGRVRSGPARGMRLFTRYASSGDYLAGTNEPPVLEALEEHLLPGGVLYDVGANIGYFTLVGARLVGPQGRVVAFEAAPDIAEVLELNVRLNRLQTVDVRAQAVGAEVGSELFVLTANPGGARLSSVRIPPGTEPRRAIDVPVVTVDSVIAEGAPPPTVVKIDVEGAEPQVLDGMARTLDEHRPVVLVETDHPSEEGLARHSASVDERLVGHGYEVRVLADSYPTIARAVRHAVAVPRGS